MLNNKMNRQEIYDKVKNHLLTQNARSTEIGAFGEPICVYRSPEGLKCAIGCLILDKLYTPDLEGKSIKHNWVIKILETALNSRLNIDDLEFLGKLQEIHDSYTVEIWEKELNYFACKNNLIL